MRSIQALQIELVSVSDAELSLAKQIIEQISAETYDPAEYVDEEKRRIVEAVERKIAGKEIITHAQHATAARGAEVVDLMAALRASLAKPVTSSANDAKRKPPRRAPVSSLAAPATPRKRAQR